MMRASLLCAVPAMLLALVLVVPFLNAPFTIDDPLYLWEAQHTLDDPLHPQAFNVVWSLDRDRRTSDILPGGIVVPYLLVPAALAGSKEWAAHLTTLLFLLAAIWMTALTAQRLGLDRAQARWAALLTASSPAVLGMAATVMPDVATMLFAILGVERILVWRDRRKWTQAAAATCWLTLAALTRTHAILLLGAVSILLLDGISGDEIRASFRDFRLRFLPVLLTPILFWLAGKVTADPDSGGENILTAMFQLPGGMHLVAQNGIAFLIHWMVVVPLTIPWLWIRFRRIPILLMAVPLAAAFSLAFRLGWVAFAAGATLMVLADVFWDAVLRRDRVQLALWTWLFLAAPVVLYLHLPSKYLLPSVPAAAILVVRLMTREPARASWAIPSTALAGACLGLLILLGIRDLAQIQKRAVSELLEPAMRAGERVWFSGHWGFQWYAERAGATPVTLEPPFPQPNDVIVISEIDLPTFSRKWKARTVQKRVCYASSGPGRIMNFEVHAGFFSSPFGYLPWVWGSGESSCYEVWRVL